MKAPSPFRPSPSVKPREIPPQSAFASRHFAVRRAGFLLRELARQQQQAETLPEIEEVPEAVLEAAEDFEAMREAERKAELARHAEALQEAHQRGRAEAFAEVAQGLDQAILALDAAARALAEREARLERDLVIPLAKAGVEMGAQLARQTLVSPEGLTRYLDAVQEVLRDQEGELVTVTAHLNPEDLALLDRGSVKPQHLRLLGDPLVSSGGVMLSATDQVIDDRFENRMREVREAALGVAADILRLAPALPMPEVNPEPTLAPMPAPIPEPMPEPMPAPIPEPPVQSLLEPAEADALPDLVADDDSPADFVGDDSPPDLIDDDSPPDFIE